MLALSDGNVIVREHCQVDEGIDAANDGHHQFDNATALLAADVRIPAGHEVDGGNLEDHKLDNALQEDALLIGTLPCGDAGIALGNEVLAFLGQRIVANCMETVRYSYHFGHHKNPKVNGNGGDGEGVVDYVHLNFRLQSHQTQVHVVLPHVEVNFEEKPKVGSAEDGNNGNKEEGNQHVQHLHFWVDS